MRVWQILPRKGLSLFGLTKKCPFYPRNRTLSQRNKAYFHAIKNCKAIERPPNDVGCSIRTMFVRRSSYIMCYPKFLCNFDASAFFFLTTLRYTLRVVYFFHPKIFSSRWWLQVPPFSFGFFWLNIALISKGKGSDMHPFMDEIV